MTRLTPEQQDLAAENLPLAGFVVGKYFGGLPVAISEELVAEGRLALLVAARDYDPGRGVRFSTFAIHVLGRALAAALSRRRDCREVEGEGAIDTLTDRGDPPGEAAGYVELRVAVLKAMQELPKDQRRALYLCAFAGLTCRQVAQRMRCSRQNVHGLRMRAQAALRVLLAGEL